MTNIFADKRATIRILDAGRTISASLGAECDRVKQEMKRAGEIN